MQASSEVIRGWRYFRLGARHTLEGTRQPWAESLLTAECMRPVRRDDDGLAEFRLSRRERAALHLSHGACSCGVYALKHPRRKALDERDVVAEVLLWGHVVEHESGYRGEHCRIERLFAAPFAVDALAEQYDVRVETQRAFALMTGPAVTPYWTEGESISDRFVASARTA